MEDAKLSRGLARELLRKVKKARADDDLATLSNLATTYQKSGSQTNPYIAGRKIYSELMNIRDYHTMFQVVEHPVRRRIHVEVHYPFVVQSIEQEWLCCGSEYYDLRNNEFAFIESTIPMGISLHTLARLFQRGSFNEHRLVELLDVTTRFVSPLIIAKSTALSLSGKQIAVPFSGGLLLGKLESNFHEPGNNPSITMGNRAGVSTPTMLDAPFIIDGERRWSLRVDFHTFIGFQDLFDNQRVIRDHLIDYSVNHATIMEALRTGICRGYPDHRMVARFRTSEVKFAMDAPLTLLELMANFFQTPEWNQHETAGSAMRISPTIENL